LSTHIFDDKIWMIMTPVNPVLIDLPLPIRTPRLLIRAKRSGDGAAASAAIAETWDELHRWMRWAENLAELTPERLEIRNRHVMASFLLRESIELLGIENATGQAVVWCGFHDIDWGARQCDTGFWVRRSSQGQGFATEATNAMLRYAFEVLGMHRVGLTHSSGNDGSRRIAEKLGFAPEGILRKANPLPEGKFADRHCYARFDSVGLPPLDVQWGKQ
jgi:RimJ/RimL family protein N-acetyltransferase